MKFPKILGQVFSLAVFVTFYLFLISCSAPPPPVQEQKVTTSQFLGRWDVTLQMANGEAPSWFEIMKSGEKLDGRFVGRFGSARPIARIDINQDQLSFGLPKQYEKRATEMVFTGKIAGDKMTGTTTSDDDKEIQWTALRAPELKRASEIKWGETIPLFKGKDMTGWKSRDSEAKNGWKLKKGILSNTPPSTDLVSEKEFMDFKLHVEFNVPEKGNSGVYLRGRYEVQVQDDFGKEPTPVTMGGVYGFLKPLSNAAKKAGDWQTYDITLIGRSVTIVLNGAMILDHQEIPGITGGALNSREAEPGPIFLQGDHTAVKYRTITITPALQ